MMELQLHNAAGSLEVSAAAFGQPFNEPLVHQVVTAFRAGGRAGCRMQKSRSDVRGGGAKPWRQKGTGRARAGTSRSPLWRTGGVTFAARPRDYAQKVNRKMYRGAMRAILSELARRERMIVVEELALDQPKTRLLSAKLKEFGVADTLLVTEEVNPNLHLAARNIPNVQVVDASSIDPLSLLKYDATIITVPAVKRLEAWLG